MRRALGRGKTSGRSTEPFNKTDEGQTLNPAEPGEQLMEPVDEWQLGCRSVEK